MVTRASTSGANDDRAHDALRVLRDRLPRLLDALGSAQHDDDEVRGALQTLDSRLLPRLSADFPLMAAVAGGGSAGKSTLFNSLLGAPISAVGGRAGLSRRVLVAVHPDSAARPTFLAELFRPFGTTPMPLVDPLVLTTPGPPQYVTTTALPPTLILLDTPDFDVGADGAYLNRATSEAVLTAADVLIYIFTNATYNAKHNTDFIRDQLTRIGRRPSILVYRAYASYSDAEVREHADTVAKNLYGSDAAAHVLGVFRADDDNSVAAGAAPMKPRPIGAGALGLRETLERLDPRTLRAEQNAVMLADVTRVIAAALGHAAAARELLAIYHDALRIAEAHAVARALTHLPLNAIVERVREIFERTDSGFVRFSRATGRVTGAPLRGLKRLFGKRAAHEKVAPLADPLEHARAALVEAANELRRQTLAEELTAETTQGDADGARLIARIASLREARRLTGPARPLTEAGTDGGAVSLYVTAPAALEEARQALLARSWSDALVAISAATDDLLELPAALDAELETLVSDFRRDMSFFKKARAALVGSLNVVPSMLGIVYVFATADPVGGTTLSAKLSSLFGLNDLWATVSIPASSGLDEATRKDLKRLLDPVVQRWFEGRAAPLEALFREHVTATSLAAAEQRLAARDQLFTETSAALARVPVGSLAPR